MQRDTTGHSTTGHNTTQPTTTTPSLSHSSTHPLLNTIYFKRQSDFSSIPRYLIEQLNEPDWDIDMLYDKGHILINNINDPTQPTSCLFAIHSNHNRACIGFLWITIDIVDKWIHVIALSVDKAFQNIGIIPFVLRYLRLLQRAFGLRGIRIATLRPKAFERYGFKRSVHILMEA